MANSTRLLTFFAGVETFHALTHAYLSMTRTRIPHPAELFGIKMTSKLHAVAAVVNGAIAVGLGARALTTRA